MGFLDRFFGAAEAGGPSVPRRGSGSASEDERAVERYRSLLRTAPPETIEQVHAEAFAKLSDAQRALIYEELSRGAGTGERPLSSEPATLARAATRAELRMPGAMERVVGGGQAGLRGGGLRGGGLGSGIAGSLLGTVAGHVVGSALVSAFLPWDGGWGGATDASAAGAGQDAEAGTGFDGGDLGADFGF